MIRAILLRVHHVRRVTELADVTGERGHMRHLVLDAQRGRSTLVVRRWQCLLHVLLHLLWEAHNVDIVAALTVILPR